MSDDVETPREYDREYLAGEEGPIRRRVGYDTDRGAVTRFVVQLEYHRAGEWRPVVRYDHDGTGASEFAHDVSEEGLHIDIYREGEKVATEYVAPPQPAARALTRAEDHLTQNLEWFVERYEEWHGIDQ